MIREIIKDYIDHLNKLDDTDFELILNKDWLIIDDEIEIIYCGDNPGINEKHQQKYFVGKAGKELNQFLEINNKLLGKTKIAFFNKTPYYSNKTTDITIKNDCKSVIYKSIELTVDCLNKIYKAKKIPIYVFGINEKSYIVKSFKEILNNSIYSELKANLTILNHPSNNSLFAAFGKVIISEFDKSDKISLNYSDLIEKTKKKWH